MVVNNAGRGVFAAIEEASDATVRALFDDYAGTAGQNRGVPTAYNHRQAGDPAKAAAAVVDLTETERPPLRLALGAEAVERIEAKLARVRGELDEWRTVTLATDHDDVVAQH